MDKTLKDAIDRDDAKKVGELLVDATPAERSDALMSAIYRCRVRTIPRILEMEIEVDFGAPGETLLLAAARRAQKDVVLGLLERGAVVDLKNSIGLSPLAEILVEADSVKHLEVIDVLLDAGANPKLTPTGKPMLAYAFSNKRLPGVTKRLLERGVDPNGVIPGRDYMPLHAAVDYDNPQAITELLAAGADPTLRAQAGKHDWAELTPLEFAKKVKRKKCASLLEAALGSAAAPATTPTPAKKGAAATLSEELWQRVARRIAQAKGRRAGSLAPGATANDIQACERTVGFKFGADAAKFFAAHNGQVGGAPAIPVEAPREGGYQLLSLAQAAAEWRTMADLLEGGDFEGLEAEPDAGVKPRWWNRKWLPFASNGQGDLLCLDFDPAQGGRKGQVVEFLHESPGRARRGDSIAAYLSSLED